MRPVDWLDENQKYFWTKVWKEKMTLSQEAMEKGGYKTFSNMEEAIKDLEELAHADNNKNQPI